MTPVIALVGRPNVGKSTLFNRMSRSRDALVADLPGLTRDRKYGEGVFEDQPFIVVDTGGITGEEQGIDAAMAAQSYTAIEEADVVLFVVDAQAGLTGVDSQIAQYLRSQGKSAMLVVNKVDGMREDTVGIEFFELGMAQHFYTAAAHNRGVRTLLTGIFEQLAAQSASADLSSVAPEENTPLPDMPLDGEVDGQGGETDGSIAALPDADPETGGSEQDAASADQAAAAAAARGIVVGIIGRPNVGKSTLVNRMLGEDRVVVFDQPGTTRDSIFIPFERRGRRYTLVDTAGVRRRKNISEMVEKFSIVKTLQAVRESHVVIVVLDAQEGLVDQDMHLLGFAIDAGRALIIALNKWDGLDPERRQRIRDEIDRRLPFVSYARLHTISALHGTGVGNLYDSIHECYESATRKWSTRWLTDTLHDAVASHPPPYVNGRRIKMRLAHQGGSNPPIIVIHGSQTEAIPKSYRRYLENVFRKVLDVKGSPIRFEFKAGENPFAGRRNTLTPRQIRKKERLMSHVKKQKHREKRRQR